jgi:hypothetical protein
MLNIIIGYLNFTQQMKRKLNYIDDYEDIKKKKVNVEIDNLNIEINKINLNQLIDDINNNHVNNSENLDLDLDLYLYLDLDNDFTDIQNKITKKINFLQENSENNILTFDFIKLISVDVINQVGKEKYIQGNLDDNSLGEQIFSDYISLLLYPTYLFQPYVFDDNFTTSCVSNINEHLRAICDDSKCLFPTWKKKYNYDVDYYTFNNTNQINQKICKNFIKKIFNFYEKVYYQYFNIMIGNILSFILSNYKINLNPLHNKFNKLECLEWIDGFNIVIKNCHRFIKNYATIIKLEWIDELDKDSLEKKMNKLNNLYINILNGTNKDLQMLFKPLEKFYKPHKNDDKSKLFIQINCLRNIKKEIDYIFKIKNYINLISKNTWVKKFCF